MSQAIGIVSGVITVVLMLLLAGIYAWAWSSRRRAGFDAAARLPLEDDGPPTSTISQERVP
jgi:cytochrome c oxidase cbb3-type subunit 4